MAEPTSPTLYLKEQYDMDVVSAPDEQGIATVNMWDEGLGKNVDRKINVKGLLTEDFATAGHSAETLNSLSFTSPNAPLRESGMGLEDQTEYALAKTDKDKYNNLVSKFGAENVMPDKSTGGFSIKSKDDGHWRSADTGFMALALNESPTLAAAIAGGLVAGPLGAIAGAGVGKVMTLTEAFSKGIRTDFDAWALSKEVGREMLYAAAGEIPGKALQIAPKLMAKAVNNLKGMNGALGKGTAGLVSNDTVVEFLSATSNMDKVSVAAMMARPEKVGALQAAETAFRAERFSPANLAKLGNDEQALTAALSDSPIWQRAVDDFSEGVVDSQRIVSEKYGKDLASLHKDLPNVKVDPKFLAESVADFEDNLIKSGLAKPSDKGPVWIGRSKDIAETAQQTFSGSADINKLEEAFKITQYNKQRALDGALTFKDLNKMSSRLDSTMERSGMFGGGELEVSDQAERLMFKLKSGISTSESATARKLGDKTAEAFNAMKLNYSKNQTLISNIRKEFDPKNVDNTIKRLITPERNEMLRSNTLELLKNTGQDANKMFNHIIDVKAARDSTPIFMPGRTGLSAAASAIHGPRVMGGVAKWWGRLQTQAQVVETVRKMSPGARKVLFSNQDALRALTQTMLTAPIKQELASQDAVREVSKAIETGDMQNINKFMNKFDAPQSSSRTEIRIRREGK